jgi:kynureninase
MGRFRDAFFIPKHSDGRDKTYLTGNSLGLLSKPARGEVEIELERWAELGVDGHFAGSRAWMPYHQRATKGLAYLTGATPEEVVAMGSLTANLHLALIAFYRPNGKRRKILCEAAAFPTDRHALFATLQRHGFDQSDLVELKADQGEVYSTAAITAEIDNLGDQLALVLWPGVHYRSGQFFDIAALTQAAHAVGATIGFDLAHAIGNVPLALHQDGPDFAVWCSYKYLNAGPGAVGGLFVHARHADYEGPRLAGWWGHDPATRFQMGPEFVPMRGAQGFQQSNPPILALAPLVGSLELFMRADFARLRQESLQLSQRLMSRIDQELGSAIQVLTPRADHARGGQWSLRLTRGRDAARAVFERLLAAGVVCDWREPDVIRLAIAPLYNDPTDVDQFCHALAEAMLRP